MTEGLTNTRLIALLSTLKHFVLSDPQYGACHSEEDLGRGVLLVDEINRTIYQLQGLSLVDSEGNIR